MRRSRASRPATPLMAQMQMQALMQALMQVRLRAGPRCRREPSALKPQLLAMGPANFAPWYGGSNPE
jgi:hypothetical protein